MRQLKKDHIYSLFLDKETTDSLIFKSSTKFNVLLSVSVTLMFWSTYFFWVYNLPADHPDKTLLTYFLTGLGSVSALMFIHFFTCSETLTIRKPLQTLTYEYRTISGIRGWKRSFKDFDHLDVYTTIKSDSGGVYEGQDSNWIFKLTSKEGLSAPIFPSLIHIPAKKREKALDFAQKISDFMGIPFHIAQ